MGSDENDSAPAVDGPKSKFPFRTKEPESFQCEIVETAGESVRRKRLAKKGTWRRIDFDPGEKTHHAVLQTDKEYVIDVARGAYAESAAGSGGQFSELTNELLNNFRHADFEETAREGNIIRYTVRPVDSEASEIVVHYDESIGMPVKQEVFSTAGEARTLQFLVELINFRSEPEADAFAIPAFFRKLSMAELLARSN